jgi:hypothetical protein
MLVVMKLKSTNAAAEYLAQGASISDGGVKRGLRVARYGHDL